ncbi:beta-glucoside-specific PTS transporter subunit IIABC [Clostridium thermobutyricum]|uniref:beta-glucoside-specific PTS transporter subunit IIABC n=1 Tax=Clostridium thermobutyricum TaxID=29372 RepID=UPI002942B793|nr:beta-glucoside-specific PTS transporter subunit IIABC [Clostridium thermobutyricum]
MGKYTKLASNIIENIGGKENVESLTHCVTRLRFKLIDESKANDDVLKNMDGVVTVVKSIGQYMVVIGEHVGEVFDEVCKQLGLDNQVAVNKDAKQKKSLINRVLNVIMGGMGPVLNLLCACGIIKGLTVLLAFAGLSPESSIYMLFNAAGDCFFYFLPLMLGYNLAKKFEIDPFFGMILAGAMCYPTIQNVELNILGYVVKASYTSTFMPILFGLLFAAPLYKLIDKYMPKTIKGFMTPLLTLVISFPLTFVIIGPFANLIGTGLNMALTSICSFSPLLAGVLLGGLWQVFVMFGVHGVLTVFAFMDLIAGNPSQMLAFSYGACFATCGTVLAVFLRTKDEKLKSVALPSFISSIFGVTEPATYGVTLPRKKMFVINCIGGAVGGIIVALSGLKMYSYAGMGVIGLLGFIDPVNPNFIAIAIMTIAPFIVSLILGLFSYKDSDYDYLENNNSSSLKKEEQISTKQEVFLMPVAGKVQALSASKDDAFASGALGKGCLLIPDDGKVYSPCNGIVRTLFPTKHAIGIVSEDGCEILIHIGINTVSLEGKYFKNHISQGDEVKAGQLLVTFEKDKIEELGYDCEIPMMVTNSFDYLDVVELDHEYHGHGDSILKVLRV